MTSVPTKMTREVLSQKKTPDLTFLSSLNKRKLEVFSTYDYLVCMKNDNKFRHVLRLHTWFEDEGEYIFGLGRALLLKNIHIHGSLSKAAKAMNIPYRAAWGKIKKAEEISGIKLLEKPGGNKKGYSLTREGYELQKTFLDWYNDVESYAIKKAELSLPWKLKSYEDED